MYKKGVICLASSVKNGLGRNIVCGLGTREGELNHLQCVSLGRSSADSSLIGA